MAAASSIAAAAAVAASAVSSAIVSKDEAGVFGRSEEPGRVA